MEKNAADTTSPFTLTIIVLKDNLNFNFASIRSMIL